MPNTPSPKCETCFFKNGLCKGLSDDEFRSIFEQTRQDFFASQPTAFTELSMGMSDDWHIAVDEGSTLIRIGTQIFGERQY